MTVADLRKAVASLFQSCSGLPAASAIIVDGTPAGADRPRVNRPYARIMEISTQQLGPDERVWADAVGGAAYEKKRRFRQCQFDITVFGAGAADYLEAAKWRYIDQDMMTLADTKGISVLDVLPTRNVSLLRDTEREEAAQTEWTIGYAEELTQAVTSGTIEDVTGPMTIGTVTSTFTFES